MHKGTVLFSVLTQKNALSFVIRAFFLRYIGLYREGLKVGAHVEKCYYLAPTFTFYHYLFVY